jgi:homogentisate 1,2-dioxygenase
MITFHPFGLHHGPQPGARARDAAAAAASGNGGARRMANEYAVMIDAHRPLSPGPEAARIEVEGYVESWTPDPATS